MDGLKARLKNSIQFRLACGLSIAIVVMALSAGAFSFYSAFEEAHELQDDMLRQTASLIRRQSVDASSPIGPRGAHDHKSDSDSNLIVQSLTPRNWGNVKGSLPIPTTLKDGLHTLELDDTSYRVLIRTMDDGQRVAVSQETEVRDETAWNSAVRTVLPLLILVPVLLLVVTNLVRKMLQPVARLAKDIGGRGEQDLMALRTTNLPSEIVPFVVAINRLLGRVSESMESQRRFVADAAHELRSPLTALSLQAERLAAAPMSEEASRRLATLRQGMDRGRNLLEQLLNLARAQSALRKPEQPVSVRNVYRRVLEDLLPLAEAKRIDIGVEGEQDALVWVSELDMTAMVKNLIDNAIRYTPEGGRIDLSVGVAGRWAELHIRDTGPGIPAAERERVFDPFYRTLGSEQVGSGLGLSIVRTIADRIGAEIRLGVSDPEKQTGLTVGIRIPQANLP